MSSDDLAARWLKGLLESCVLGALRSGSAYGYEIASRIGAAGFARPRGGSLYPILARLEAEGLVEPTWVEGNRGPGRKYYRLTPAGLAWAEATAEAWTRFVPRVSELIVGEQAVAELDEADGSHRPATGRSTLGATR